MNCSRCGKANHRQGQRYCQSCHAAYMRAWRKTTELTAEQRFKSNCRSYAHIYKKRGHIMQEGCVVCGSPSAEMHHADYNKPLNVVWMCRAHHLELHKEGFP